MKLEIFFEKFDQFANAPDAVAKMREIVLELAVHGKLNQGSSADRKGWSIKRLKDLTSKIGSGSTPHGGKNSYHVSGTPLIRSMNVHFRKFVRDGLAFIDDVQASVLNNVIVEPNDVLLNITGASIGRVATAPKDMAGARVNQHVAIIRTKHELLPRFLEIVLASPTFQSLIDGIQVGATREALTKRMIEEFEIPLPATSEQVSVISRVDELMALCDRLEAQQKERKTQHTALARAAIARFDEAPTPANLNFLFHPSYSVTPADLRKSILSLAVQGRLVPQNSSDDSAVECLASCGVRGREAFPESPEWRHTVPPGWVWLWFAAAGEQRLGKMLDTQKNRGELKPYLRNTNVQWMRFELNDVKNMRIDAKELDELRLQKSDLLICEGGEPGRCAIWNEEIPEMYFQKALHRIRPCKAILPEYLALNLELDSQNGVLDGYFTGATIKHLTGRSLARYPIPIPPLLEQQRIVARIDQLMGLVGQLEVQLTASEKTASELLDAVVHELLNPTAEVLEFPCGESNHALQRAAIGCYAIEHLKRNPSFGRVMLMKVCYLSETHLGVPLGWQPMRQAAGPWDPWLQDFESLGTRSDWFTVTEKTLKNDRSKIEYSPKKALKSKAAEAVAVLGTQKAEFDRLLNLFADKNTEEAEIITTLFAAWNDFLMDGKIATDDEIIHEVRENWHESKERFTPALLQRWLDWMRRQRLTPKGHGPRTRQQLTFRLK